MTGIARRPTCDSPIAAAGEAGYLGCPALQLSGHSDVSAASMPIFWRQYVPEPADVFSNGTALICAGQMNRWARLLVTSASQVHRNRGTMHVHKCMQAAE